MTASDAHRLRVIELDHLVLRCRDVDITLGWYCEVLGLEGVRVEEWRQGSVPFPSVRVSAGTIIDLVPATDTDLGGGHLEHLCLTVAPFDADALVRSGRFRVRTGPVQRFGARGDATSVYVLDPDDTVIELRYYPTP